MSQNALRRKEEERFAQSVAPADQPIAPRTPRPATVRVALPADEAKLFDLFMIAADENAMAPINEAKVRDGIANAVYRRGGVIGVIDGKNGELAGAVGIIMAPFWYSEQWHCEEMLNFVHPNYRAGSLNYARDLIQFAKWWSEQLGMTLLMGVLSHHRTEGKVRLYRRLLPFAGALFLYRGGAK